MVALSSLLGNGDWDFKVLGGAVPLGDNRVEITAAQTLSLITSGANTKGLLISTISGHVGGSGSPSIALNVDGTSILRVVAGASVVREFQFPGFLVPAGKAVQVVTADFSGAMNNVIITYTVLS